MTPRAAKTRKPIRKQPASPSLTSLFSSITKASSNSSGSNSTVTPESYARNQRNSRHGHSKSGSARSPKLPTQQPTPQPTPPDSPVEGRPNVFAFMEEDNEDSDEEESHHGQGEDEDEDDSEEEEEEDEQEEEEEEQEDSDSDEEHEAFPDHMDTSYPIPIPSHPHTPEMSQYPITPRGRPISGSFHSDSGISIRSSSPEHDSPFQARKPISNRPPRLRQLDLDSSPESFYARPSRSVPQTATFAPLPPNYPPQQSLIPFQRPSAPAERPPQQQQLQRPSSLAAKLSATSTSEKSIRPIYRRFETLTNTLLLQLQSELQRLESDLARLDATLHPPSSPVDPADPGQRPSQRQRQLHPAQRNDLEWQRAELFGLLGAKLEQYHRVLGSYHVLSKMDKPGQEQVERLKGVVRAGLGDGSFLARVEDLATLSPASEPFAGDMKALEALKVMQGQGAGVGAGAGTGGINNLRMDDRETALFTGGAVLMTILAFKFVPSFVARVVLGAVVVAAMVGCGLLPELEGGRWRRQVGVYAGAVVALAGIVG